ncbi:MULTISPECIES: photosystem I reaction center subunit XI [Cyanophyceae]|uniref:Photosystem I reaction center subunit XI n=1 Tax=Stenomitos frigidus AS-A4 TaxID=2933935 RepID=A0ABV0KMS9_9CYAN|nr:photosystem I reaction center subunit XI [Phormidium sp. FACHB-592]
MASSKSNDRSSHSSEHSGVQDQPQRKASSVAKKPMPSVAPFVFAAGDPQEGNLATPINNSAFTRWFINQLPAYRQGVSPFQRGLQVGLSHGFWLLGPFVALGPLRDTNLALFAGLGATIGLVGIATLAIAVYAESAPLPPIATLTTPKPPTDLGVPQGWRLLARGFWFGGTSGAFFATVLLLIFTF